MTYMGLFFAQHGYQVLDEKINTNYIALIELFQAIENFLGTLKRGLAILENYSALLIKDIIDNQEMVCKTLDVYFKKLHFFLEEHTKIRDRCQIDLLMAQERDKMADESDESD